MNSETFRSRLAKLLQKSRKAVRLYAGMEKRALARNSEYNDMQVQAWKEINEELTRQLTNILNAPHSRQLAADIYSLRDRFYNEWRMTESETHLKHKSLTQAVEHSDFIKAAQLSRELVVHKAKVQALQAVHHEIQGVISQSHVSNSAIELDVSQELILPETETPNPIVRVARVIPMRKRAGS